jgi:hypothetical protein
LKALAKALGSSSVVSSVQFPVLPKLLLLPSALLKPLPLLVVPASL